MIRLDRTTRTLGIVLGGAITTNQLQVIVSGVDRVPTSAAMQAPVIGFTQIATTNSTTDVTICTAPTVIGRVREVESISVRNRDTAAAVVSIEYDDNGTDYVIFSATLSVGDFLVYSSQSGWQVFDSTGQLKVSSTFSVGMVIGDAVTGGTDTRVLFTKTGPVLGDDTNFTYNYTTDVLTVNGSTFGTNSQIGGTLGVTGDTTLTGDLAVNGGDQTSTATTFNLLNATVTTLNLAGAGTTLTIGATTGTATIRNATTALTGVLSANGTGTHTIAGPLSIAGASAGQIVFPATQNASAGANTLDDYEEGTWTPTDASGAGLSLTIGGTPFYDKIGRQVTAGASVTYPVTADASANAIGGWPFAVPNNASLNQGCLSVSNEITALYHRVSANSSTSTTTTNTGASLLNSTLSTDVIIFESTYHV